MKISARNVLKGKITDIKKGATTAHVLIDVNGTTIIASIPTNPSTTLAHRGPVGLCRDQGHGHHGRDRLTNAGRHACAVIWARADSGQVYS
jgi:hypothetical protein